MKLRIATGNVAEIVKPGANADPLLEVLARINSWKEDIQIVNNVNDGNGNSHTFNNYTTNNGYLIDIPALSSPPFYYIDGTNYIISRYDITVKIFLPARDNKQNLSISEAARLGLQGAFSNLDGTFKSSELNNINNKILNNQKETGSKVNDLNLKRNRNINVVILSWPEIRYEKVINNSSENNDNKEGTKSNVTYTSKGKEALDSQFENDLYEILLMLKENGINQFGVTDFCYRKLGVLFDILERFNKKTEGLPKLIIDHTNLSVCCKVTPELLQVTKSHGVKLIAHNDNYSPFDKKAINQIVQDLNPYLEERLKKEKDNINGINNSIDNSWSINWASKILSIDKERDVIYGAGWAIEIST